MLENTAKWILFGGVVLGLGFVVLQSPTPKIDVQTQKDADLWAHNIEKNINKAAWDKTEIITWSFAKHDHIWDKKRKLHSLTTKHHRIIQSLHSRNGLIKNGDEDWILASQKEKDRAYSFWINDSFWLNPLVKLFDEGTKRHIVEIDNKKGLMVSYMEGGVTPGDSYVWFTDSKYRPVGWKMWVSVIPIGGVGNTWDGWMQLSTGAWVSTEHDFGWISLKLSNVQGGQVEDIFVLDPFETYCLTFPKDC